MLDVLNRHLQEFNILEFLYILYLSYIYILYVNSLIIAAESSFKQRFVFQVAVKAVYIGSEALDFCHDGCRAIIDSSSSHLTVPSEALTTREGNIR